MYRLCDRPHPFDPQPFSICNPARAISAKLVVLWLQAQHPIQRSVLANVFPQTIQYRSRNHTLQRFLALPTLTLTVLWFPQTKY